MRVGLRKNRPGDGRLRSAAPGVGIALIVAFLAASLAPCPPPVRAAQAHTQHAPDCHEQPADAFLSAPCPCGCGEQAPAAGSSARLGVALPSTAPGLAPRPVTKLDAFAMARFEASFVTPIDHIPLTA